ncbi:NAC domain-containing protein 100 [Dichanthelium oligosanthes]|uniref:NAC domain-containing protein 100 n=1 Tax=Dichanthelium oligosanthes TaxID=888268 RepID=A0A1E5UJH1_9POAL|nr:NAC domain-containing protein 100 [Dichanthelium oligosanthes]
MEVLPAGFRFFPTDEELITCYLARKAMDASFTSPAIRGVDLYKTEPWDLPCEQQPAEAGGGDLHEGYFFCTRGSKYPSGVRARRATRRGYWKSTGKDKAVHGRDGRVVGTRKTLVFYGGRAPRGEKTGWVMHEYAMGERSSSALLRGAQSEWVICKVFMRKHPTSDDRKLTTEETVHDQDSTPGHLPPMVPDGCGSEQEAAAAPPVVTDSRHTVSHSGAHAMDGNEKDHHHRHQMVQELLVINHHGSSCASPSLFNRDDQLRAHCSALPIMQMQSDDADYYLPELLEYNSCDDLTNAGLGLLDTGAEVNRRAEITTAAVGPLHLDGLYWNFGF